MKKKILITSIVAILLFIGYKFFMKTPKQVEPSTTKKINPTLKSTIISKDVNDIVDAYLKLKNAFINSDTFDIKQKNKDFLTSIEKFDTMELKKDSALLLKKDSTLL